jgi:transcriptional regulator with XRE-family HTH domain
MFFLSRWELFCRQLQISCHLNLFLVQFSGAVPIQDARKLLRRNVEALVASRGGRAELARSMGIKPSSVTKWLKGDSDPYLDKVGRIAAHFGVAVSDLFRTDPPRHPRAEPVSPAADEERSGHVKVARLVEEEGYLRREIARRLEQIEQDLFDIRVDLESDGRMGSAATRRRQSLRKTGS